MEVGVWDDNNKLTVSLTLFLLSKSLTYFLKFLLSKWYIKFLPQFRTFASSSRCVVAKLRDMSNVHPALHVYKFEIGLFPHNLCSLLGLKRACANLNTFCNSGWVGGTLMPGDRNLKTGFDNLFIYFVKENPMVACWFSSLYSLQNITHTKNGNFHVFAIVLLSSIYQHFPELLLRSWRQYCISTGTYLVTFMYQLLYFFFSVLGGNIGLAQVRIW